ncbi:MAG: alpha/beta hydrolase [Rhodocyclaceae bacterium]|nr:alpha/beta hydrolase [Rhodocyclaceae bacterium]MBX3669683.1 alpha/beta hydrolase [Rhodocyclaceae bacterium]
MSRSTTERIVIPGPTGNIELALDIPADARGLALVAHPHPLYGGTLDNKVAHTLARTFRDLGFVAMRPNFRGVGKSEGEHDNGGAETEDMMAVLDYGRARFCEHAIVLGGFSFGGFVTARVARRLAESGKPAKRIVLVGAAAGSVPGLRNYATPDVPADTIVIHGEVDETVPLVNVIEWARPQNLPIVLVPGADHFFHGRLNLLRDIILRAWKD